MRKGLEHFSNALSVGMINSFKCEQNHEETKSEESDEEEGSIDNGGDEDGYGFDYDTLRNIGLDIMGIVEKETGENFIIMSLNLSQSTLWGRSGSNVCTVISVIT